MGVGLNSASYYSDRYGTSTEAPTSLSEGNAFEDHGAFQNAYGNVDHFLAEEPSEQAPLDVGPDIEGSIAQIDELQNQIETDPVLDKSRKETLLSPLAAARGQLLQAKNSSPEMQQRTLAEVDAKIVEVEADLQMQPELGSLSERSDALKEKIQSTFFSEEDRASRDDFLRDLDKARNELDLNPTSEELAGIEETISGIEGKFEDKKSDIDAKNQENLSKFDDKKNALLDKIQASPFLKDSEKDSFRADLESSSLALRDGLEKGEIPVDVAIKDLDKVDYRAGGADRKARLTEDFDSFSSKVPSRGYRWEFTKELAGKFTRGLAGTSDKAWDPARQLLDSLSTNEDGDKYETAAGNNVVMQILGTIFYKMAEQDDQKFKEYLDLIPRDVRQKMKSAVLANEGERHSADGYDSDAEKEANAIFGIPTDCAQALDASLRWSEDTEKSRTRLTDNSNPSTIQE